MLGNEWEVEGKPRRELSQACYRRGWGVGGERGSSEQAWNSRRMEGEGGRKDISE